MQRKNLLNWLAIAAVVVGLGGVSVLFNDAPAGAQNASAVSVTLYPATALTSSGTVYSSAPRYQSPGYDVSDITSCERVSVYVTTDIATSGTLTATVQTAADTTNFTTADFGYANPTAIATYTQRVIMTADGTERIDLYQPIAATNLRVQLVHSATMTPTVKAVCFQQ